MTEFMNGGNKEYITKKRKQEREMGGTKSRGYIYQKINKCSRNINDKKEKQADGPTTQKNNVGGDKSVVEGQKYNRRC